MVNHAPRTVSKRQVLLWEGERAVFSIISIKDGSLSER